MFTFILHYFIISNLYMLLIYASYSNNKNVTQVTMVIIHHAHY